MLNPARRKRALRRASWSDRSDDLWLQTKLDGASRPAVMFSTVTVWPGERVSVRPPDAAVSPASRPATSDPVNVAPPCPGHVQGVTPGNKPEITSWPASVVARLNRVPPVPACSQLSPPPPLRVEAPLPPNR